MYFSMFPQTYYSFDGVNASLITNFLARVSVSQETLNNVTLYDPYMVSEGETPESVADKVYGNPFLHWVILLTNNIVNPFYDWCMAQDVLIEYCQSKYDDIYGVHHWENPAGLIVDSNTPSAYPVSNFDYENKLNESRRIIKILNADLVQEFIKEFQSEMGN